MPVDHDDVLGPRVLWRLPRWLLIDAYPCAAILLCVATRPLIVHSSDNVVVCSRHKNKHTAENLATQVDVLMDGGPMSCTAGSVLRQTRHVDIHEARPKIRAESGLPTMKKFSGTHPMM